MNAIKISLPHLHLCRYSQILKPLSGSISILRRPCSTDETGIPSVKEQILEKSLTHVHSLGWTQAALAKGADDLGYPSTAHGLFPRGGGDLSLYFYKKSNLALHDKLTAENTIRQLKGVQIPTKSFIRDALKDRIWMTAEYQDSWHEAMALLAYPNTAPDALRLLAHLVDDIWHLAGDKSHDTSWSTKRASIAFIYKTTELHMLQDKSPDLADTWSFLDRRFDDIAGAGSLVQATQDMAQVAVNASSSVTTLLRNLTGFNKR